MSEKTQSYGKLEQRIAKKINKEMAKNPPPSHNTVTKEFSKFMIALKNKDPNLKEKQEKLRTVTLNRMIPMFWNSCCYGRLSTVKRLAPLMDINIKTENGATGLVLAIKQGYIDIVSYLLNFDGLNIKACIATAAFFRRKKILQLLLENHIYADGIVTVGSNNDEIDFEDVVDGTFWSPELRVKLEVHFRDPKPSADDAEGLVLYACAHGDIRYLNTLSKKQLDFVCKYTDKSPIMVAAANGYDDIVKLLLRHGVNTEKALEHASYYQHREIISLLGGDVDTQLRIGLSQKIFDMVENINSCSFCGKEFAKKRCPCGKVRYCGKECQKQHWNIHKKQHKHIS